MERVQKICVAAFIYKDGKVLILRRSMKETFLPGHWDIPGGKLNFGEAPEEALKREVKEEAGLAVEPIVPCSFFSYLSRKGKQHNIDIQFLVEVIENKNKITLSEAHTEYKWIGQKELNDLFDITDNMKGALAKGFKAAKKLKLN